MPASDGIYNLLLLEEIKWSAWLIRFIISLRRNYWMYTLLQSKYSGILEIEAQKDAFLYYLYFDIPNLYIQFYSSSPVRDYFRFLSAVLGINSSLT